MLSAFFIDRPRFAAVIAIATVIAGLVSLSALPVAQYPSIAPSSVQVTATFPGADAVTLLKTVVEPLEARINGVKRMMYLSSTSADNGQATITVTFPPGADGDINTVNVQNRVSLALPQLPPEVQAQGVVVKEKSTNMLLMVDLFSPGGSYDEIYLANYLDLRVKDELARIPGVGDVALLGAATYAMRVWLDPDRMARLAVTPSDVVNAIRAQNVQVSAGSLGDAPAAGTQSLRLAVQTQGRLEDARQFESIVLRSSPGGAQVLLKDVARVELGAESYGMASRVGGRPSAKLIVYQLPEGNGLQIARDCRAALARLKAVFPPDLDYVISYDTTIFIQASIDEVVLTLFEALALVVLVTYLFLQDWRAALVPTVAIPVSLVGTFAAMLALGYSVNLVTLFGLILAIGIVVDDAIVVVENASRLMAEEGLAPPEAARLTMRQVTGPVVSTTLVLLAMFLPVCFLPGVTGEMYRQFGVTISVAVTLSSVNALTLSPALCAVFLRPGGGSAFERRLVFFRAFNGALGWVSAGYARIVASLARKAFVALAACALLMAACWRLYSLVPSGFIPEEDQGAVFVNVQLPDAAAFPRTERVSAQAAEILRAQPGVAETISVDGFSLLNGTASPNTAFLVGILSDWSERRDPALRADGVIASLAKHLAALPGAVAFPFQMPAIPGVGSAGGLTFVIQDSGALDPERLQRAANAVIAAAGGRPELDRVYTTYRASVPRIFLRINRDKAFKMGVPLEEVNAALQGMQGCAYVNDFNAFGKVYKVVMQADIPFRSGLEDLAAVHVRNSSGEMVPLSTLAEVEMRFGPSQITRYNLYPSVTLYGSPAPGYSSGQAMRALEEVAAATLPAGMMYDWTDMSYQERLAAGRASTVFALALLFIYLFLVAQYESWAIPFAVMFSVPAAFLGALVSIWARGVDNNIYTQVGFVLLFGLACKTAILIVEFAKERREAGADTLSAALEAANLRLRAVLMTAVSFILGVLPLVFADGAGAVSRRSLGTAICGGMVAAAILGTLLVPAFYVAVQSTLDWLRPAPPRPPETARGSSEPCAGGAAGGAPALPPHGVSSAPLACLMPGQAFRRPLFVFQTMIAPPPAFLLRVKRSARVFYRVASVPPALFSRRAAAVSWWKPQL